MAAGLVSSPPFRLAQALASLTEPDGRGCAVDGLKDLWSYRKPLGTEERELLDTLAARYKGRDWRDVLPVGGSDNVETVVGGTGGIDPLITFLYGPTFNVAGLRSGFLGPNTATIPFIVPGSATATLDMRLVVDTPADEIVLMLRRHLDARGFEDISIQVYSAFDASQTSPAAPAVQAMLQTLADWNVTADVWPIQAGGGPWTVVPNAFGVPCVRGGAIGGGGREVPRRPALQRGRRPDPVEAVSDGVRSISSPAHLALRRGAATRPAPRQYGAGPRRHAVLRRPSRLGRGEDR
jgi:acetylornithine deacetylase/succinyl-diaminopimelate desuccinylase-like protein